MPAKVAKKATAKKAAAKKIAAKKAAAPAPTEADWTILVYIAGDNDLDNFGRDDLFEMKKVGSTNRLHFIVQRDTATPGAPTCRYRLRHGTTLTEDVVADLGETNTGDPAVLKNFLEWGVTSYPAKRTMAVLWNHGSGWDDRDIYAEARRRGLNPPVAGAAPAGDALPLPRQWSVNRGSARSRNRGSFFMTAFQFAGSDVQRRAIAFDDEAQDFLDSVEMKNVFNEVTAKMGRKFDVIGMDACLMSMIEVGVQLRDAGEVFCGSQELEPGQGWPYDRILTILEADPAMDGQALCKTIVMEFVKSYPAGEVVTQSAFDLGLLGRVREATDDLGVFLTKGFAYQDDAVISAVDRASRKVQRYDTSDYADLSDFCQKLAALLPTAAILCQEVQEAVATCVFASSAPHQTVNKSQGISIYLPGGKVSPLYKKLDFAQGGWGKFLAAREY
ncbi:MAG: clostripain-related cysteine peptidase [Verrucomicrobiota bacterium]